MPPSDDALNPPRKKKVGFALMDPERVRELGAKGGAKMTYENRPFVRNKQLAIEAGRKGGSISKGGGRPPATASPRSPGEKARLRRMGEYEVLNMDPLHPNNRKV